MALAQLQDNRLYLIGQINFDNAGNVFNEAVALLKSHQLSSIIVDLSKLEQGNTLVLAICVQIFRKYSKAARMQMVNVPEKMLGILKASHLEQMLK